MQVSIRRENKNENDYQNNRALTRKYERELFGETEGPKKK